MGRNILEVLYIQNRYFYVVLHAKQIRDAKMGVKENLNITIVTEELMELHNVREFKGNLAVYNSFYEGHHFLTHCILVEIVLKSKRDLSRIVL